MKDSAAGLAAFTEAVYEGCAPFAATLKPQGGAVETSLALVLEVLPALRLMVCQLLLTLSVAISVRPKAYADGKARLLVAAGTDSVT